MIEATDATYETEILDSDVPVVVYFWAPWCGPCKSTSPAFENASREFGEQAKFVKVNIDENNNIAAEFGVRGIPTMALVKFGAVMDTVIGARSQAQISAWLMTNL